MPSFNKEVKKYLFYILAVLLAFIASLIGLDKINSSMDKQINVYKGIYEQQKQTTNSKNN